MSVVGRVILAGLVFAGGCRFKDVYNPGFADSDPPADTDPASVDGMCGDGMVQEGESCDDGEGNGPGANCFADCALNPVQSIALLGTEVFPLTAMDARAVARNDAPAGAGAWGPRDSDTSGDGVARFLLNVPLYDVRDERAPELLEQLAAAPWTPPVMWLANGEVRLADLDEISFWTRTPTGESRSPFLLVLYTQADGLADGAPWFGHVLHALPGAVRDADEPKDTWVKWTARGSVNVFTFCDQRVTGTFSVAGAPTLADLQTASSFDWASVRPGFPSTAIDYGAEVMRLVSIQSAIQPGPGEETAPTEALIDLIEISLKDGRRLRLDLEP